MNLVDDRRPERRREALDLLDRLAAAPETLRSERVGITGAPGAGKSTLLDALTRALRAGGRTVGIVAVDPSSRLTGGALLGDRIRVRSGVGDPGTFFRSMAARDRLGGLADATVAGVEILAAVFDVVLVETVGVGQSESEISEVADTVVFVAQPGAGDTLQFMKAGLLELPDIFAVNKADLGPAAERTASELEGGLALGARAPAGWRPPVLRISARDGRGVRELLEALAAHRLHLEKTGELARRRTAGRLAFVRGALLRRYGTAGLERLGGEAALVDRVEVARGLSGHRLVELLGAEIEAAWAGTARA